MSNVVQNRKNEIMVVINRVDGMNQKKNHGNFTKRHDKVGKDDYNRSRNSVPRGAGPNQEYKGCIPMVLFDEKNWYAFLDCVADLMGSR